MLLFCSYLKKKEELLIFSSSNTGFNKEENNYLIKLFQI